MPIRVTYSVSVSPRTRVMVEHLTDLLTTYTPMEEILRVAQSYMDAERKVVDDERKQTRKERDELRRELRLRRFLNMDSQP